MGVGLNVSSTREELPVPTRPPPWSSSGAGAVDRSALLVAVLTAFSDRVRRLGRRRGAGAAPVVRPDAARRSAGEVRVDLPGGEPLRGRAVDVDEDGRLLVDDGTRVHALGAGDVVHVRPV